MPRQLGPRDGPAKVVICAAWSVPRSQGATRAKEEGFEATAAGGLPMDGRRRGRALAAPHAARCMRLCTAPTHTQPPTRRLRRQGPAAAEDGAAEGGAGGVLHE